MRRQAGLPARRVVYPGTEILRAVKGDGVSRRSYTLDGQRISVTPACDLQKRKLAATVLLFHPIYSGK